MVPGSLPLAYGRSVSPLVPPARWRLLLALWAAAMAAFAFTDLAISRGVVDVDSGFGRFVAVYGEVPGALVTLAGVVCAVAAVGRPRRWWHALSLVALSVFGAFVTVYLASLVSRAAVGHAGWLADRGGPALAVGGVVVLVAGLALGARGGVGPRTSRFGWLSVGLGLSLVVVVVLGLKVLWGRVRYVHLDAAAAAFTPWYLPQGPTGHHSFPSGHTAMAWMVLPLLAWVADAPRRRRAAFTGLVVAWGLLVAAGRVRYGAHYASDVTMGAEGAATGSRSRPAVE